MRLVNSQIEQVEALASRLYLRESDLYQFAVSFTLNKLDKLTDDRYSGVDLLPLLLEIREDIINNLNISKHLLFKIVNIPPSNFVEMTDIELLLTPTHLIKPFLQRLGEKLPDNVSPENCLKLYLYKKYNLVTKQ
ncbi:MAG: hypothetical protein NTV43_15980 [Methylococcales bacterium]|nr:hypothetical protein [Methylococcales bacterium]